MSRLALIALTLALTACGGNENKQPIGTTDTTTTTTQPVPTQPAGGENQNH